MEVKFNLNWPWARKLNEDVRVPSNVSPTDLKNQIVGITNLDSKVRDNELLSNYHAASAFSSIYTKVERFRKDVIIEVDKLREFYLTDVLINQFADDALAPDVSSNDILTVYSDREDINKELESLQNRINFDELATNIAPDIVAYGEYTVKTEVEEGKGLVDLNDTVEQDKVVPLVKNGNIEGYLKQEGNKILIKHPSEYIKFTLSNQKVRVNLMEEYNNLDKNESTKKIPKFVRVGKSLLYPVRSKIKELELLEQLVPATKLSKLAAGTVVGVSVPAGFSIDQAAETAKKVEGILNKKIGVDSERGQLTLENIMSSAGRLKVVPIVGDKGQLQKFDYKQDEPDELLNTVEDIRRVICNSVGVPYELIFVSESPSKGEMLRRYARYIRKLKAIQRAIADGIRQICIIHLTNKGFSLTVDDVKVDFKNKLVEIDNLNKLEFLDTTVTMLKNARDFVGEMGAPESPLSSYMDYNVFKDFIGEQLSLVGLRGFITKDPVARENQIGNTSSEPKSLDSDPDVGSLEDQMRDEPAPTEEPVTPEQQPEKEK